MLENKVSSRFQGVPEARVHLDAKFGKVWQTHIAIVTRISLIFTRVPVKVPGIWVAFRSSEKPPFGTPSATPWQEPRRLNVRVAKY